MNDDAENSPGAASEQDFEGLRNEYLHAGQMSAMEMVQIYRNFLKEDRRLDNLRRMADEMPAIERLAKLTGQRGLAGLLFGLEKFLRDCAERDELPNPSEQRTIGQTVDLLGMLFQEARKSLEFDLGKPVVLVVDDEPSARKTLMYSLEKGGIHPVVVDGSRKGLDLLRENKFDLLLFDIMMPEMDGYELGEEVRKMRRHKSTPLIYVTAAADFQNKVKSLSVGASDMIAKPFHMLEIIVKVKTLVLRDQLRVKVPGGETKEQ
jgi:CheY-like chemotaxis protein